ncbi:ABC transporter substrate-binding protein [Halopseudomonas sp. SMJS2]|uniref:heme/hemin ABC transporter substrate-binding protein n=1 Tax=Halopseudomonas sp. SMJS2 TaxID=3041098 RepID=UPI00245356BF|nr:ABC transporter substrate-binding protein [Halopseudomonas sp. SMJS2]WGK61804.1 ABC transporter substrate-binding protein [Halopseudomonas sp. SMJS2]
MRLEPILAGLCTGLLLSTASLADELPQRWISAGGAATEWIVELGGQDRLVGVDTTSQHPETVTALPSVGYLRQLSAEGVLTLAPDLLLGTEEMGPPPVLIQLEKAGVRIERLSASSELGALEDNLLRLGALLGEPERAQLALEDFHRQLNDLQRQVQLASKADQPPGVLLLLGVGGNSPLVAGRNTMADWLLRQAGARNLAEHEGYKNLAAEAMLALDADWLVLTDRQLRGVEGQQALMAQNPSLAASRAVREGHLLSIDPTLLVGGLGPRLPDALRQLSHAFYPQLQAHRAEASQ